MDPQLSICPKCASIKVQKYCDYCKVNHIAIPITLNESINFDKTDLENQYINTLIKDTFDPKAREKRIKIEKELFVRPKSVEPIVQNKPKCPTCGSTNIYKITSIDRAMSFSFWGFGSSKLGKTMGCNNCGYKW